MDAGDDLISAQGAVLVGIHFGELINAVFVSLRPALKSMRALVSLRLPLLSTCGNAPEELVSLPPSDFLA